MQRRSARAGALRDSAASALADLAARKASGTTRTADYKLHEEADIYETVDEQTYAAISARKRKEARDFIDVGDGVADDDVAGAAAMELEFEEEDELSLVRAAQDRKRKRTSAPRTSHLPTAPTKRVSSAFFNSFHPAQKTNVIEEAADGTNNVLDPGLLDADLDRHVSASRAARRKRRKAVQNTVGDLLFDAPIISQQPDPTELEPVLAPAPLPEPDEYAAPPPSLVPPKPTTPALKAPPPENPILEDSLDADALLAAADAAVDHRPAPVAQPVAPIKPLPVPSMPPPMRQARPVMPMRPATETFQLFPPGAKPQHDENGDLLMFWTDAHDVRVNGGQHLYLFGKVPMDTPDGTTFASTCIHVEGMDRVMYVLPREARLDKKGKPTSEVVKLVPDVYEEISSTVLGSAVSKTSFAARSSNLPSCIKAKKAVRTYPFGDGLAPRDATEYLKIKFPYSNLNRLEPDSSGETYSRVFGTRTSASEAFCMKRKLKGPGWIRLKNVTPLQTQISHAKFSFSVSNPADVSVASELANKEAPTLSGMCINVKTMLNTKSGAHEIVMISAVYVRGIPLSGSPAEGALEPGGPNGTRDFTLLRPPEGKTIPFGFNDRIRSAFSRGGGVEVVANEAMMLNNFLAKLIRYDPDVIIGHDVMGFGLDVLIARMSARRSREWSRLGRLIQRRDLTQVVKNNASGMWFKSDAIAGRLFLDTYMHAKELLMREKDYSLSALSYNVLAVNNPRGQDFMLPPSTDVSMVPTAYETTDALCRLVMECSIEARTAGRLAAHLSVLPLSRQLTCISGNLWSHTLRGARAERIEYLLCHEFKLIGSEKAGSASKAGDVLTKLLLPDKLNKSDRVKAQASKSVTVKKEAAPANIAGFGGPADDGNRGNAPQNKGKSARRKPQYSGGLVLEPKKGFYDRYVLQLDFNSLYPSIIQEYNICFTTLNLGKKRDSEEGEDEKEVTENERGIMSLPDSTTMEGVLPRVLRRLVEQRRQVKKLLKEERQRTGRETLRAQQLDIRQLAIKLTANSLYGCLGFEGSRFFARPLAEMVTSQGRDTLQKTVDLARDSFNAQVIYGDTDSLFVYTGFDDISHVRKLGMELKRDVNKKYKTLEIEIDAIYKKMLLLKKKKYAALKVVDPAKPDHVVREVKGLDLVRHDWCDLSHDASENFISHILNAQTSTVDDAIGNILSFLTSLASKVNGNEISLSKYVITRSLTKRPQDYSDFTSLPHVAVAMRLINEHKKRIKPGDFIKYVICQTERKMEGSSGSGSGGISARAYHPDEVIASKGKLIIDVKYYLENQVLPPIMRLCDPIQTIDASRVAVSLGLDGRRYERRDETADGNYLALGPQSASEKFRDAERIKIQCVKCETEGEVSGVVFSPSGTAVKSTGLECHKCLSRFETGTLINSVTLALREWVQMYYTTPLSLNGDDGTRRRETRDVGLGGNAALARRKFDEAWLYRQLRYAHYVMDVNGRWDELNKHEEKAAVPMSGADAEVYETLLETVDEVFDANAYRFVGISQFLAPLGLA